MSRLSEEMSVLDLRKERNKRSNQMPKLLRSRGRMELSTHEIVREKEMYSNFVSEPYPQTPRYSHGEQCAQLRRNRH